MGDSLRRLLYPLVLPVIVACVWTCGWVRQQDDRAARGRWTLPPAARQTDPAPFDAEAHLPRTVAEPIRTEFFATAAADDGDVAEER
jgi:hypothetical protein